MEIVWGLFCFYTRHEFLVFPGEIEKVFLFSNQSPDKNAEIFFLDFSLHSLDCLTIRSYKGSHW